MFGAYIAHAYIKATVYIPPLLALLYVYVMPTELNEDMVVYDGVVKWEEESGVFQRVTRKVRSMVGASTNNKEENAHGMLAMMPDWEGELKKGIPVEELCLRISRVKHRQLECFSGFATTSNLMYDAKQNVEEVCIMEVP